MQPTIFISILMLLTSSFAAAKNTPPAQADSRIRITQQSAARLAVTFDLTSITPEQALQSQLNASSSEANRTGLLAEPGRPALPAVSRFVVVPAQAGLNFSYQVTGQERVNSQPPANIDATEVIPPAFLAQVQAVEPSGIYPPAAAEISSPIVIRGVRLVKVTTYPLQYDYENQAFIHNQQIDVAFEFTDAPPLNPVTHPNRRGRSKSFDKFLTAIALNGADAGRDDPSRDDPPSREGRYLVVTREECLPFIREFIEWKRKSGVPVEIISLNEEEAVDPEAAKEAIQERYDAYLNAGVDPFDQILLVGDRTWYQGGGPEAEWILQSFEGETTWPNIRHGDYLYACLEGNDDFPDVGISRWWAGSENTLSLAVGRTLAYEMNPSMDNPEWFSRAGTYYQHWGQEPNGAFHPSMPMTARWARMSLLANGFDPVESYENLDWDQEGNEIAPVLGEWFGEGMSLLVGRAQIMPWANGFDIEPHQVFPINLLLGGLSNLAAEGMTRTGDADNLRGPVATACCWGDVPSLWVNAGLMEITSGLVQHDLPLGWARNYAWAASEQTLPAINEQIHQIFRTDIDYYGDPGITPWRETPRIVEVELLSPPDPGRQVFEVLVTDAEGEPASSVEVTFYAPGEMPEDPAEYSGYEDYSISRALTDGNGIGRFFFDDPEFVEGTPLFITATGRNIRPFVLETEFQAPATGIALADFVLEEEDGGNGDGNINPAERFSLGLTARNLDDQDLREVTAIVTTDSPWIIIEDDNQIAFGDLAAGDETNGDRAVEFEVILLQDGFFSIPDGSLFPDSRPIINVEFAAGQGRWRYGIPLDPHAPSLLIEDRIVEGEDRIEFNPEMLNRGRLATDRLDAVLTARGRGITIVQEEGVYPEIGPGESESALENGFIITLNSSAVPGSSCPMEMALSSPDGFFRQIIGFTLQIGQPRANAPQGPDAYGYICFDNSDEEWDLAPDYDWVEINPDDNNAVFEGWRLDLRNNEFEMGDAEVVDLGFETQFYGQRYAQITVASNGFIALGDQLDIVNFQNFPLDRGIGGGAGMIAPFWSDLRMGEESGVFAFQDEDNGRFIIEWNRMSNAAGANDILTCQVIIHDREVWISETGDSPILIQYRNVVVEGNIRQGDQEWRQAVPFPSVGISSPDGSTGLSYCWNNTYPVTSARLQDRRAILYTTSGRFNGVHLIIGGQVTDLENDRPMEGVQVGSFNFGFVAFTETDAEGGYRLELPILLVDDDIQVTFRKQGYNDTTAFVRVEGDPDEEDSVFVELDMAMLHPEFTPSTREVILDRDHLRVPLTIRNDGNGPLEWSVERRLMGGIDADPWELRQTINAGEMLDDDRLEGVVFAEDKFFVSGANVSANLDDNTIYILSREGELVDSFLQVNSTRWGYKDIDYDGEFIWAAGDGTILALTTEGRVAMSFDDPLAPTEKIACDRENRLLYLSGTTTSIIRVDYEGNLIEDRLDRQGSRIYGLAYWPDDPDGFDLYILNSPGNGLFRVHKMNTESGDTMLVHELEVDFPGAQQSAFITNELDIYSWVFMSVQSLSRDNGGDRIEVHQLDARRDWFGFEPVQEGRIEAGQVFEGTVTGDPGALPDTLWEAVLHFTHTADSGWADVMVRLDLMVDVADNEAALPVEFSLDQAFPNPFNSRTLIHYSLPQAGEVSLRIYDLQGRMVATLFDGYGPAGQSKVVWNSDAAPTGLYICRMEAKGYSKSVKLVLTR